MDIKTAAIEYYKSGLSIIPIGKDKIPLGKWTVNQTEVICPNGNFDRAENIGLVCGKVSGGIITIDIDCKYDVTGTLFKRYKDEINKCDPALLKLLTVQKTKNKGYHFIFKCSEIEGNLKLANRYVTDDEKKLNPKEKIKVLIETRGEKGYIVLSPSEGYEVIYGNINDIKEITPEQKNILYDCAKLFNDVRTEYKDDTKRKKYVTDDSPFVDYNERGDVLELLQEEGWTIAMQSGTKVLILRPGGTGKWSADWDTNLRIFYVYTTSSEFTQNTGYNSSQVLAMLKFGGDYAKTAEWLYENGYGTKRDFKKDQPAKIQSVISLTDDNYDFLAKHDEIEEYIKQWRNGTFQKGLTTGISSFDDYFRFKRGNFNIINGKDNVGKSVFMWYLMLLSALLHDWKWIVYSNENRAGTVVKKLIEFYCVKEIHLISEEDYKQARRFVDEHFTIITNDNMYNFKDILTIVEKLSLKQKYDGILIDPYNSLKIDMPSTSKLSTHEYHYEAASEMQIFTKKNDICIYLNCHVVTYAAREDKAPGKADTEGGAKFPNKADDFLTLHRHVHGENWKDMEIHTRKIKEIETGGSYTKIDSPYILKMMDGNCGYTDTYGCNPIIDYWKYKGSNLIEDKKEIVLKPNISFHEPKQITLEEAINSNPSNPKNPF